MAREFTTDKATDFMAILTKIKAANPDVIMFGGMDAQAGPMVKQIKQLGITAKYITGDGGCSPEMIKLAGDAISSSVYCTMAGIPLDKMPGGKGFPRSLQEALRCRRADLLAPCLRCGDGDHPRDGKSGSAEPSKYLAALKSESFPGVTGNIAFDEKGDIRKARSPSISSRTAPG